MKVITLMLEDDEQFIIRSFIKQLEIMAPDIGAGDYEPLQNLSRKIVEATQDLSQEWKNDIGRMQKAARAVRGTPQYVEFLAANEILTKLIIEEMKKLKPDL